MGFIYLSHYYIPGDLCQARPSHTFGCGAGESNWREMEGRREGGREGE